MKTKLKSFSLLTGSILLMAVGTYFFKFSNNFTFGGITGLAVVVAKTGIMTASDFTFVTNMLLPNEPAAYRPADAGIDFCHCSSCNRVRGSI